MAGDILICPHCRARLRRAPDLEAGTAVACPRCQTRFAAPADTGEDRGVTGAAPGSLVYAPASSPARPPRHFHGADLDDEDRPRRPRHHGRALNTHLRVAFALHGLTILGALGTALVDVTAIVYGGPLISLLGLYVAALGLKRSCRLGVAAGMSSVAFSLFVFSLIGGLGWGPEDSAVPVCWMGAVYAAVAAPFSAWAALAPAPIESARGGGEPL